MHAGYRGPTRTLATSRGPARLVLCLAAVGCLEPERVHAAAVSFTSPRKPSLFLASSRTLCGFRVSCCTSLSLFNASQCSAFRAACQALRPCSVSVSFRLHRARLSLLCSAALYSQSLAQALLLCCYFLYGSNAKQCSTFCTLSSIAALLLMLLYCTTTALLLHLLLLVAGIIARLVP